MINQILNYSETSELTPWNRVLEKETGPESTVE
jgi:hypothetical protein